ncbi:MAG TPA: glutamine-hydrolyzing carbamoyl-phosphate synthase small subunit [Nannocystaceae bacterium]|nr:glutamine-hydrolyzing carbamoyl-phosphate synthase small subunit [Nannocystaceae bacterium]
MSSSDPHSGEGVLALADGRVFRGQAFGARATVVGEVVFNTAMAGYQEIFTDPSYTGQIVCLTVAEVGNVGCNEEDLESLVHGAEALVIRSLSPTVSSWRAKSTLSDLLLARGRPGLSEVDTRALTRHLRKLGAVMGALSTDGTDIATLVERARKAPSMNGRGLAHEVSTAERYAWDTPTWHDDAPQCDVHVVVVDYGVKLNILRHLRARGMRVTVVPSHASANDVLELRPDGVLLSNGPGDPAALPDVVAAIRELCDRAPQLPVFGICLGHQLLSLALGGRTYKLKFGHHGGNHPVRDDERGAGAAVQITSQNHGFAVDAASLEHQGGASVTHVNLFDDTVAGLRLHTRPLFGVQYHPEASPGPHDSTRLFDTFAQAVRAHATSTPR